MPMFQNNIVPTIQSSLRRAKLLVEESRMLYASELIDTYEGFGSKYLQSAIEASTSSVSVKTMMIKMMMCYPILQNFIDSISGVYDRQPVRKFYVDGKLLVDELVGTDNEIIDKTKIIIDPELKNILDKLYNREFQMRIKEAERMTNLLCTTVHKINYREGQYYLDFISNDIVTVIPNDNDATWSDGFYYLLGSTASNVNDRFGITVVYEYWTPTIFQIIKGTDNSNQDLPNRAYNELGLVTGNIEQKHVGSGFPPFIVMRNKLSYDDFWNISDEDIIKIIKQINMAFTELRYLQRFGSFGLKYIIDAKLPADAVMDPVGIWEIQSNSSGIPGENSTQATAGEFSNASKIEEVSTSIFEMLKFLYNLYGIDTTQLITTREGITAESKRIDRKTLMDYIQSQQDIWALNEEYIFQTLQCVYNRDHGNNKLPQNLEIKVDYYDVDEMATEMEAKINNWLIKIEQNISTRIDWIKDENPDLNDDEAKLLLEHNKAINSIKKAEMPINDVSIPGTNQIPKPPTVNTTIPTKENTNNNING